MVAGVRENNAAPREMVQLFTQDLAVLLPPEQRVLDDERGLLARLRAARLRTALERALTGKLYKVRRRSTLALNTKDTRSNLHRR